MLLGAKILVYTDHKNLTYELSKYSTQRVLRWRLTLEEFGAEFHYKTGESNFIADALSRVPTNRTERSLNKWETWNPTFDDKDGIGCMVLEDLGMAQCLSAARSAAALSGMAKREKCCGNAERR